MKDYNSYIDKLIHQDHTKESVQNFISKELDSMRNYSGVADIFEGISGGMIRGISGNLDSNQNYWDKKYAIHEEAFAHMYEAQFDDARYNAMKKYFPSALTHMEGKLRAVAYAK